MNGLKVIFLIVAVLVIGQITDWGITDHLAVALFVILVAAWIWTRLSLRGISVVRRAGADRAQVGQSLRETLAVRNGGRISKLWIELMDRSTLPGHDPGRVVTVPGRSAVEWDTHTVCVRRGRFHLGPVELRSGDPLGIFTSRTEFSETPEVIVYPAVVELREVGIPEGALSGGIALERRTPYVTPNVAGVRDYTPGDGFNRISWSATARLGRLMVKEFDQDPTADVWIVLDLHQAPHRPATRPVNWVPDDRGQWPTEAWLDSTEEYAVTVAASLGGRFLQEGRNVGLIASGAHLETIPSDRSDRQLVKILESLAVVRADGAVPLAELLVAEGRRLGRHDFMTVITPSLDERWVAALAEVAQRGVGVSAVLIEPETFGSGPSSLLIVSALAAAGIPAHLVKYGEPIARAFAGPAVTILRGARG
ncbi:MAG: DUF58 domain-containing protein [Chloroflexi bacterium]|nr:DUF58 domain-containing protein [Chloroflexota bacterium]